MIRTIWTMLVGFWTTLFFSLGAIFGALFGVKHGMYFDGCARYWSWTLLWASRVKVKVEGIENFHREQPDIVVANHSSWFDIPALATSIPKRVRFVAKKELGFPIFGHAWKAAGHISIDRQDRVSAIESLEKAGAILRSDNSSVIIFPEGTRSPTPEMLPFKKGAFMLALHSGVPIIPTAIIGAHDRLPKGRWRLTSGPIIVRFGEPIPMAGFGPHNRDELVTLVRARIEELMAQPSPRLAPPSEPTTR